MPILEVGPAGFKAEWHQGEGIALADNAIADSTTIRKKSHEFGREPASLK